MCLFVPNIRVDADVAQVERRFGCQSDVAHYAVPVALRMVGNAVCVIAYIHVKPVVYPQCQGMFAGLQAFQHVTVRGLQGIPATRLLAVHEEGGRPVCPFQFQFYRPVFPPGGDIHFPLIPCRAYIMFVRVQPERHFDVSGFSVGGIFRCLIPRTVHNLPRPFRIKSDVFAFSLLLQRTGQVQGFRQRLSLPFFFRSHIFRV